MEEHKWVEEIINAAEQNSSSSKLSEKQLKIVEAAIEIFAEKGYSNTSTNEIAKKAGVAEGTIFRHYKTKKELLLAIVTPTLTKVIAPFLAKDFVKEVFAPDYKSYEEFLEVLVRNRYHFVKSRLPILKIFLQEVAFHNELNKEIKDLFTKHVYVEFTKIVDHFQAKNQLIPLPSDTVIRLTITTVIGFLITRFIILPDYDWDDEQEIAYTVKYIVAGLKAN
ncbi:TetR/AcrR family transcriptional regulator [Desulfuribacillus alkaliarsenatis]|uniref:TetR family transcriptional regulator n=1 Tax=Desulfuribacillus alkaliarsenatis TaxID=766136 RepID=A0A1E5G352_9FIRM|nr:TetR/AcrR family transcriptional regulator [Desulfuribacillus alkaliarsenatis]OEF97483.1 TetR family transcriptional regulator [Desulfuribacillus alkaliarsenatis]